MTAPILAGLAVATGALAGRYARDLRRARARLRTFERMTAASRHGPVEYCEWGEGSPVLLVHGVVGGCDVPPSWRALVPPGSRIIAPSRFGYLGSPMPPDASVAAQADAFADLLDALGIQRAAVLGFSAGSTSAVQFALRHPDRVSRLALVAANAPHARPVTLAPRPLAPVMFSQPVLWFLRVFMPGSLARIAGAPVGYAMDDDDRRTLDAIFDSFFPMAWRKQGTIFDGYVGNPEIGNYPLEGISAPTLGVHALDDPLAPYEDARAMVARIAGSRWVRVERGGHIFIHDDQRAVAEIARFLASERDPGGDGEVDRDRQQVLDHSRQGA